MVVDTRRAPGPLRWAVALSARGGVMAGGDDGLGQLRQWPHGMITEQLLPPPNREVDLVDGGHPLHGVAPRRGLSEEALGEGNCPLEGVAVETAVG